MSIPHTIKLRHRKLPTTSGVYLFRDGKGKVVYVGKATNLKSRVGAYFRSSQSSVHSSQHRRMIEEMVHEVYRIDWVVTDSVIEALILEANLIRKYLPRYNVREKDDKSFLYVVVTREQWPKVMLVRGSECRMQSAECRIFGPYTSASAIRAALDLMRKWFPWSDCHENMKALKHKSNRPCFDYHIGRCPGVCVGAISRREYMKNIRNVILMLEGKKKLVIKNVKLKMQNSAKAERFEEAEIWKRKLFALQHIRDIAVLTRGEKGKEGIDVLGRIEGYDISNISGTSAVGSMVVFKDGEPAKGEYKRFRIKGVSGINDVAMMREVITRRFSHSASRHLERSAKHEVERSHTMDGVRFLRSPRGSVEMTKAGRSWPLPDLIVIDGGWGQVNVAQSVVKDLGFRIKVIGIAKGFKRKQDRPVFDKDNPELARIVENYKDLLLRVRDEAHRFAVAYHRKVRSRVLSTRK